MRAGRFSPMIETGIISAAAALLHGRLLILLPACAEARVPAIRGLRGKPMRLRIVIPFFFVGLIITAIVALSQRPAANGQATAEAERLRLAAVATQEAA